MERAKFILLVRRALSEIPPPFKDHLKQIDIVVKQRPSSDDRRNAGIAADEDDVYGVYFGVPLTERDSGYNLQVPDVIHIYQEPLEQDFAEDEEQLVAEIRTTVLHEVGHFFGIGDERLDELGMA